MTKTQRKHARQYEDWMVGVWMARGLPMGEAVKKAHEQMLEQLELRKAELKEKEGRRMTDADND